MKINKILADKTPTISFEVFPPKAETGLNDVKTAAGAIAALGPSFMSVTYGAAAFIIQCYLIHILTFIL